MVDSLPLSALLPSYITSLDARKRSKRTQELAELYAKRLIKWLEESGYDESADAVTSRRLEEYFVALGKELSATTTGIHYRTLRAFFGWLTVEEEIDRNPFKKLQQPKADEVPVPIFSDEDLTALLDVCKGRGFERRRDRALVLTLIDTGVRLGELVGLGVEDLNAGTRTAFVSGKTGSRVVAFGPTSWEAMDRYLRSRRSHPYVDRPELWLGNKGPISQSAVAQLLKRRGKEAGVEGVNPHRFRHTFCHSWLQAGGNETDLQHLAGWSSPQMIRRYAKSTAAERAIDAHTRFSPGDKFK